MIEILPFFMLFAVTNLFTPGPNNIMLTSSGANYGIRRSLPHVLGVDIGFSLMVFIVGLGFGAVFATAPEIQAVLRWLGAAFMVYLGLRIAVAGRAKDGQTTGRPFRFVEAAAFQWVNPKAWTMAVGAFAAFAPEDTAAWIVAAIFAAVFFIFGLASSMTWTVFGTAIGRLLSTDLRLRVFNITLGALTIASVGLLFV